jgi:DNA-binding transcriptional LysR family regulator
MDLRQLEMLRALVDHGGFKRAGEHLRVSHSAVHRKIRMLEDELGSKLLVRVGKQMKLTRTGEMVLASARRVNQELTDLRNRIGGVNRLQWGQLRIGTGTTVLTFFLTGVLERFRKRFGGMEVSVMTGTADHVAAEVVNGNLDVGVVYSPRAPVPGGAPLACEVLYQDPFVIAVGDTHPLARRKSVALQEVMDYPFIVYPPSSHVRRLFDELFRGAGLTPRVAMELENEEAIEKMIGIDMGIGFLSKRRAARDRIHGLNVRGRDVFCEVGVIFRADEGANAPVREFTRMCREAARTVNA